MHRDITDIVDIFEKVKYKHILYVNTINSANHLHKLKEVVDAYGISKSLVHLINQTENTKLAMEELNISLDPDLVDYHFSRNNDISNMICTEIDKHVSTPLDLKREGHVDMTQDVEVLVTKVNTIMKDMTNILSHLKEELSNSSKEGIPSKMNKCLLESYPNPDASNRSIIYPDTAQTMDTCGHDKHSVLVTLDGAIDFCKSIIVPKISLSEKMEETEEIINQYKCTFYNICTYASQAMALGRKYINCC
jgi:hypothetical protein